MLIRREDPELTAKDVADRVRPLVEKTTIGGVTLRLNEPALRMQHGYWIVSVRPSHEPEKLSPYYDGLVDLEEELRTATGLKISISSGEPLTEH